MLFFRLANVNENYFHKNAKNYILSKNTEIFFRKTIATNLIVWYNKNNKLKGDLLCYIPV
jgi:hypothetical protein